MSTTTVFALFFRRKLVRQLFWPISFIILLPNSLLNTYTPQTRTNNYALDPSQWTEIPANIWMELLARRNLFDPLCSITLSRSWCAKTNPIKSSCNSCRVKIQPCTHPLYGVWLARHTAIHQFPLSGSFAHLPLGNPNFRAAHGSFWKITATPPFCPSIQKTLL